MSAHEEIRTAVKSVITDAKQVVRISDAVFTALDTGGWFTTDSDHLALMRSLQDRLHKAAMDPETPPRDLAALTNRLQSVSREVTTLEERVRQEGKQRGKSNANGATATAFDPSSI